MPNYLDDDDDGDGVPTADEDVDGDGDPTNDDSNGDGTPDFLDPCDPDPMAPACATGDTDGDGVANELDPAPNDPCVPQADALACPTGDTDGDGLDNQTERDLGLDPDAGDTDGDGVPDGTEVGDPADPTDTDDDGQIDALDLDDDGDGILTAFEDLDGDGDPTNDDTDGDGTPDYLDPDDDGDDTPTADEQADPDGDGDPADAVDTDDDGTPDYLDEDTPDVPALAISAPADGAEISPTPTISGTATPGATVTVTVDGMPVGMATADANGDWSLTIPEEDALDAGMRSIAATRDDGATAEPVSVTVVEGGPDDQVSLDSPADGDTLTESSVTVTGTANPGATVEVFVDGQKAGEATADDDGDWSLEITDLDEGERELSATSGEAEASVTVTVELDDEPGELTVSITSPEDGEQTGPTPTFTGQASAGAEVTVEIDGEPVGSVVADDDGAWSLTLGEDEALAPGDHELSVTATLEDAMAEAGPVTFQVTAEEDPEDEFQGYELAGGCACGSAPGGPPHLPGSLLLLVGGWVLARRRRRR